MSKPRWDADLRLCWARNGASRGMSVSASCNVTTKGGLSFRALVRDGRWVVFRAGGDAGPGSEGAYAGSLKIGCMAAEAWIVEAVEAAKDTIDPSEFKDA